jgi:hypothetical protein
MNLFKKLTFRIFIISIGFLAVMFGISYAIYVQNNEKKEFNCGTETTDLVCGNTLTILSENEKKGKDIFNSNCAACHKLNSNITGPALSKVDSTLLWNWMKIKNEKVDSTKFKEMKIDYHKIMWNDNLNETELSELYQYTKTE